MTGPELIQDSEYDQFTKLSYGDRTNCIIDYIKNQPDHYIPDYFGRNWNKKLVCHLIYTIRRTISEPNKEIKTFIKNLKKTHSITEKELGELSIEFKKRVNNPVRIWQINTLV